MNDYGCKQCIDVCQVYQISLPSDLTKVIRVVQDNITDGTIIESDFWPDHHLKKPTGSFFKIQVEGPWNDVLIYYFECTKCKQHFELNAETYHGSGGSWKPKNMDSL